MGLLVDELRRRGVLDDTLLIVASDHGEHLGDHGLFFHGGSLYRQLVQVPLVFAGPGEIPAGRTVAQPVSLCDIPATVVDLLGLGPTHPFPGRSLARSWRPSGTEKARSAADAVLMETTKPELLVNGGREPAARGPMRALIVAGMHYIRMADGTPTSCSTSPPDVEEQANLANNAYFRPVSRGPQSPGIDAQETIRYANPVKLRPGDEP